MTEPRPTTPDPGSTAERRARATYLRAGSVTGLGSAAAQVVRGFAMGAADVVPGVSGGTVALLLGIYEHLIATIRQGAVALAALVRLDLGEGGRRLRAVDWWFLLPLLGGVGLAIVTLAGPLSDLLDEQPVLMSAVFAGLVIGSILVASRELTAWASTQVVVAPAVAVATFFLLGLRSSGVTDPSLVAYLGAGAVAICAMILPGVSGSFILVMLGMYEVVLDVVDARDLLPAGVFALGAVAGLALFSALLNWLLANHRDTVLAALVGLMAGSLRVLWPWPAGEDGIGDTRLGAPVTEELVGAVLAVVVSAIIVVAVAWWANRSTLEADATGP